MFNRKKKADEENLQLFLFYISKLEPIEFMGLVRVLNVEIFKNDKEKTPKSFENILSDVIDNFIKASQRQKKNILKILKAAVHKKK